MQNINDAVKHIIATIFSAQNALVIGIVTKIGREIGNRNV